MSADNMLVILKEPEGDFTVRMVFASGLDNFDWYEGKGVELPCEEFPYATREDMARDGREWAREKTLQEAYDAARKICCEEIIEYGVMIWCPHRFVVQEA